MQPPKGRIVQCCIVFLVEANLLFKYSVMLFGFAVLKDGYDLDCETSIMIDILMTILMYSTSQSLNFVYIFCKNADLAH